MTRGKPETTAGYQLMGSEGIYKIFRFNDRRALNELEKSCVRYVRTFGRNLSNSVVREIVADAISDATVKLSSAWDAILAGNPSRAAIVSQCEEFNRLVIQGVWRARKRIQRENERRGDLPVEDRAAIDLEGLIEARDMLGYLVAQIEPVLDEGLSCLSHRDQELLIEVYQLDGVWHSDRNVPGDLAASESKRKAVQRARQRLGKKLDDLLKTRIEKATSERELLVDARRYVRGASLHELCQTLSEVLATNE